MKFSCSKSLLSETISNVSLAVANKSTMPIIEGILINTKDNLLTLTCYNLELGIEKTIIANTINPGSVVLNTTLLSNIINKMPEGNISFEIQGNFTTKIYSGNIEFSIAGLDPTSFPELPLVTNEKKIEIDRVLLKTMLEQTIFASSLSEQTPINTGCLFDLTDNLLTVVAVDGYRLALRKEPVPINDNLKIIVPTKSLSETLKLINKIHADEDEKNISIIISNKHVVFEFNGYYIISRLIEGEFIDYNKVIPTFSKTNVIINTKDFMSSINRATIIINEKTKTGIKAVFTEQNINVMCETSLGKINEYINCDFIGEAVKIGFNHKYMLDALRACDCEDIKLHISGPTSPLKITPIDDDSFLFLVLPIRLKDED